MKRVDDGLVLQIMGVEFYPITLQGAVSALDWMLAREDGCTRLVVTANPVMVMAAQKDPEFMTILRNAHLVIPDGGNPLGCPGRGLSCLKGLRVWILHMYC